MTPDEATPSTQRKKKRAATRRCPICGNEAWSIAYGMVLPSARQTMPKTEFAGCIVVDEMRIYPATGNVEFGIPEWCARTRSADTAGGDF